jgi:hypothetical protein
MKDLRHVSDSPSVRPNRRRRRTASSSREGCRGGYSAALGACVHGRDLWSACEGIKQVGQRADKRVRMILVHLDDLACRRRAVLRAREAVGADAEAVDCTHPARATRGSKWQRQAWQRARAGRGSVGQRDQWPARGQGFGGRRGVADLSLAAAPGLLQPSARARSRGVPARGAARWRRLARPLHTRLRAHSGAILPEERAGANRTLALTLPKRRGGTHGAHSTHIGTHSTHSTHSTHVLRKQAPSFWKLCWGLPRATALALSLVSVVGCDRRRYTLSARLEQHAACDVAHQNAACMRAAPPRAARCARPVHR